MKYCSNCGKEIDGNLMACPSCNNQMQSTPESYVDRGGFGWGLLGFVLPLVGLVLYIVWKDLKPKNSKAAGIGALVSVIMGIVMWSFIIISIISAFVGLLNAVPYYYY